MLKTIAAICMFGLLLLPRAAPADPTPLPADPGILSRVEQISESEIYADIDTLVGFYTRHTYSDTISNRTGIGAARNWLQGKFGQLGVPAEFFHWTGNWGGSVYDCYNVHGTLEGSGGEERLIVIGAHLDSRTISSSDTAGFAPGADDDCSGIASLLEMSRILSDTSLSTTIVLAASAGEEQGLLGAEAYSQWLYNSGIPVTAMINLDMIGHIIHPDSTVDSVTVRCYSGGPQSSSSRQLARYLKWVGEAYTENLSVTLYDAIDRPGRGGDHIPFYELGYTSARLIETAEDVAYQHDATDVLENMSVSYTRRVVRLAMGAACVLASAPPTPPAPTVANGGDGQSLLISWPDTLTPPGGLARVAYRDSAQLYWEDIISVPDTSFLQLTGLTEGVRYEISLSIANDNGLPSRFSDETSGIPITSPPPEDFETTSTPTGVEMRWKPRPEPNTLEYIVERSLPGGAFAEIAVLPQPDSTYFDSDLLEGQLYLYRILTRNDQLAVGEPSEVQKGQLASHHLGILIIDATPDGGQAPPDEDVDAFYDSVLVEYQVEGQWDRADSMAVDNPLSDADLAPYSVVLAHGDHNSALFGTDTTAFRKYLMYGGRLLICGWRLSYSIEGGTAYAHSFGPGDFLYDLAGIDSIQVVLPLEYFVGAGGQTGYPDLTFDAVRFPQWGGGLPFADAIWTEVFLPDVEVIATFLAMAGAGSPYHGLPVALRGGALETEWVLIDAPPYYMTVETATGFLQQGLDDLGAPQNILEVTIEPLNPPIIIPPEGGVFQYDASVSNIGSAPVTFDFWVMVTLPNGSPFGPAILRTDIDLAAGSSLSHILNQTVPPNAPAGEYGYTAYVGDYDLNTAWDQDGFNFSKSGSDADGNGDWVVTGWDMLAGSDTKAMQPLVYAIWPPAPNPFNPMTTITYTLPQAGNTVLEVFDMQGRKIATLVEGWQAAGNYEVRFDGGDLGSGVYLYRFRAGDYSATGKLVFLK